MNNLKLLLLGLITPLLCGVSFAFTLSNDEITYLNNNALNQGSFNNVSYGELYHRSNGGDLNYCVVFSGLSSNKTETYWGIYGGSSVATAKPVSIANFSFPYFVYCSQLVASDTYISFARNNINYDSDLRLSTVKYWVVDSSVIFNGYLGFDIQGLLDNYNQCSTDLNQCDTSVQQCLIDKETLSGSLASCNAVKISLNNNIDSLTLQLQNCLGQSCEGSGDYGSGVYFNQYSLYRTDDDLDYSTPITNNLFLPLGYKGKINEDNILSIAKISTLETAYQFNDEDKITIIDILSICMLFLLTTGSTIGIIVFLKRLILKKS